MITKANDIYSGLGSEAGLKVDIQAEEGLKQARKVQVREYNHTNIYTYT